MTKEDPVEILLFALRQMSEADLHEGNCADLSVASRRIRNMANEALNRYSKAIARAERVVEGLR